jgi:glycosyltransferase involved in cell wall biosynthesis
LLQVLFFISATVYLVMSIRALWCLRHAHRLPLTPTQNRPRVSVIFAARDEADRVENTVRHLLAQQGIDLEIIAVDDRSRDQTGEILKKLSQEDARVRPKRVDSLPEDWLGKCHACHIGASSATGEWLLFTDADCWLKPDVLARAIAVAEREIVQHITLTPGVSARTVPAAGWHIAFLITVADWIARTNTDHPRGYLGVGAFNLVRADTYRKFGGHETLRLTVVDDVKLGKLVRKVGARTRAFIGGDDVECHWGVTVRHIIKIMEKNYFAAADYRIAVGPSLARYSRLSGRSASSVHSPALSLVSRRGWDCSRPSPPVSCSQDSCAGKRAPHWPLHSFSQRFSTQSFDPLW